MAHQQTKRVSISASASPFKVCGNSSPSEISSRWLGGAGCYGNCAKAHFRSIGVGFICGPPFFYCGTLCNWLRAPTNSCYRREEWVGDRRAPLIGCYPRRSAHLKDRPRRRPTRLRKGHRASMKSRELPKKGRVRWRRLTPTMRALRIQKLNQQNHTKGLKYVRPSPNRICPTRG